MRKGILITIMAILALAANAQKGIGIGLKVGLNFANVTGASSINSSNYTGYHIGGFFSPKTKKIFTSRTELIYSKQGYNFKNGTTTGNVKFNYLIIPQFFAINITKFVQVHAGGQIAFLLNANADSTASNGIIGTYDKVVDFYKRIDYGVGAGIEIHPHKGYLFGVRYNASLNNLYNKQSSGPIPSFIPAVANINFKNNVVQVFVGYRF